MNAAGTAAPATRTKKIGPEPLTTQPAGVMPSATVPKGICQPPRKSATETALKIQTFANSPKKNMRKRMPEYSVL